MNVFCGEMFNTFIQMSDIIDLVCGWLDLFRYFCLYSFVTITWEFPGSQTKLCLTWETVL